MVDEPLKSRIERFVEDVGQNYKVPYAKVEHVSSEIQSLVIERYVPRAISQTYEIKSKVFTVLEDSLRKNKNHGNIEKWRRAAWGVSLYLLLPTEMHEVEEDFAADVVVRLSRWFHTHPCNLWKRLSVAPRQVVSLLWDNIEQLYNG